MHNYTTEELTTWAATYYPNQDPRVVAHEVQSILTDWDETDPVYVDDPRDKTTSPPMLTIVSLLGQTLCGHHSFHPESVTADGTTYQCDNCGTYWIDTADTTN